MPQRHRLTTKSLPRKKERENWNGAKKELGDFWRRRQCQRRRRQQRRRQYQRRRQCQRRRRQQRQR